MIKNLINHKVYIGQTILNDVLKNRYGGNLEKGTSNMHLKNSIRKYGNDNFQIIILCYCSGRKELDLQEKYFIAKYNATDPNYGYNIDKGGHSGVLSQDGRNRMIEKLHNYWNTHPEERKKRSIKNRGNNNFLVKSGGHTEESKKKMREIRIKQIKEGKIDMNKVTMASKSASAIRKRVISSSKYWIVQYDLSMNELNRWHTIKDMYNYLVENKIDTHYKSYKSFKQKTVQKLVFEKDVYKSKGYIFRKIKKE